MKNIFTILLVFMTLITVTTLESCGSSDCETTCINGDCTFAGCECDTGWTGENCDQSTGNYDYGYNCISGDCDFTAVGPANYETLSDCEALCSSNNGPGYNCISGTCSYNSNGGVYSSQSACENACSNVSGPGYNCNGSSCNYVSSGANFTSQSACEANCSPSNLGYSCAGGSFCAGTYNNPEFTNLNDCEAYCATVLPDYTCNTTSGQCTYVNNGGQYFSLADCEANCGTPSQYAFWTIGDWTQGTQCWQGFKVTVVIQGTTTGTTEEITEYYTVNQMNDCNAFGCAIFVLDPGSYTAYWGCGGIGNTANFLVLSGACETWLVSL